MLGRACLSMLLCLPLIVMTGCAATAPPTPSPASTAAQPGPIFATDEEALAGATEAYAAYLAMSDSITETLDADPMRIAEVVSPQNVQNNVDGFLSLSAKGSRSIGATSLDSLRLQGTSQVDSRARVVVYLCVDVSGIRLHDESGVDVTPAARPNRIPIEATLVSDADRSKTLLVDRTAPWTGESFC